MTNKPHLPHLRLDTDGWVWLWRGSHLNWRWCGVMLHGRFCPNTDGSRLLKKEVQ